MKSPIQLRDYTIDYLQFEVNQACVFDGEKIQGLKSNPPDDKITMIFNILRNPDNPEQPGLRVDLSVNENENLEDRFYRIRMRIFGRFALGAPEEDQSIKAPDLLRYFVNNGLTLLLGIMRAKIAELTSGAMYPKLILPAVNFYPIVRDLEINDEDLKYFERLIARDA